ncbi:hypothetical protein AN219_37935 [Streptomyces nanshensis]|nr:hypothetical protein AN219_37935 [Streptomyces nanshensis]
MASDNFAEAVGKVLSLGEQEEALRREYPLTEACWERTSQSHYTAYTAMALEDRGWRMMFPAQATLEEAEAALADILRRLAVGAGELQERYLRAAQAIADGGELQIIIGPRMYRLARVEQTLILTGHGPEAPRPGDRPFPEEFDDRRPDSESELW